MGQNQMFELLRETLLVQKVLQLLQSGIFPISPVASWDFHNRLNRRVKVEFMGIPVANYLDKISDPSSSELNDFFEEYKNRSYRPGLPEPGFRQRKRMAIQYVRADFQQFLDAQVSKVTEQEVRDYYEEHKDDFRQTEPPSAGATSTSAGDAGLADQPMTPLNDDSDAPAQPSQALDPATAPSPKPAVPDAAPAVPDAESAASPVLSTPEIDVSPPSSPPNDSSSWRVTPDATDPAAQLAAKSTTAGFRAFAVASQAESTDDVETEAAGSVPDSNTSSAASDVAGASSDQSTVKDPGSDKAAADAPPTDRQIDPLDTLESASTTETPDISDVITDDLSSVDDVVADAARLAEQAEVQYKTIEEVTDEIRRAVARERAQADMDQAISEVRTIVETHSKDRLAWRFAQEQNPSEPEPAPPSFAEITSKYPGMTVGRTPLVDQFEIEEYEIGKATELSFAGQQLYQMRFADVAFFEDTAVFQPRTFPSSAFGDVRYVFWKIEEKDAYVPKLEEVRDQVIRSWKSQPERAGTLAAQEAERAAQEARQAADRSLKDQFGSMADRHFTETEAEVSWMTTGSTPLSGGQPSSSRLGDITYAGYDLRELVFRLAPGEIGVAKNQPGDTVYVVRVISTNPSEDMLRQQFLTTGATPSVQYLAALDNQRAFVTWLKSEMEGLRWNREPYRASRAE
jgi:hypothetical protein